MNNVQNIDKTVMQQENNDSKNVPINNLPEEITTHIFSFLRATFLAKIITLSKHFSLRIIKAIDVNITEQIYKESSIIKGDLLYKAGSYLLYKKLATSLRSLRILLVIEKSIILKKLRWSLKHFIDCILQYMKRK